MRLSQVRKNGTLPFLRPDGKSQVTVEYDANGKVLRVDAVVISTQHSETVANDELRAGILKHVIQAVIPAHLLDEDTKYHINPTGRFVIGGPDGRHRTDRPQDHRRHLRRHGPSRRRRVQRQGSDQGRPLGCLHGALHREERGRGGLADRCEVQLAYAIGVADPVSVLVETFGTAKVDPAIFRI
jgi:S-adenosylmethionine synthetase